MRRMALLLFVLAGCASSPHLPTDAEIREVAAQCERTERDLGVAACALSEIERRWPDAVRQ